MTFLDIILNEDVWFPVASAAALIALAALIVRYRSRTLSKTTILVCGLNLFYGLLIGIMAVGHLLAISIKTGIGTLPTSTNLWFVFSLGFALALPAWCLVGCVRGLSQNGKSFWYTSIALNTCVGAVLLPFAARLAAPAVLNVLLLACKRRLRLPPNLVAYPSQGVRFLVNCTLKGQFSGT